MKRRWDSRQCYLMDIYMLNLVHPLINKWRAVHSYKWVQQKKQHDNCNSPVCFSNSNSEPISRQSDERKDYNISVLDSKYEHITSLFTKVAIHYCACPFLCLNSESELPLCDSVIQFVYVHAEIFAKYVWPSNESGGWILACCSSIASFNPWQWPEHHGFWSFQTVRSVWPCRNHVEFAWQGMACENQDNVI